MAQTIRHFGEQISLARIVAHYRANAVNEPARAPFWRQMTRIAIADAREQRAQHERIAA